jgi:hypothetical protein
MITGAARRRRRPEIQILLAISDPRTAIRAGLSVSNCDFAHFAVAKVQRIYTP